MSRGLLVAAALLGEGDSAAGRSEASQGGSVEAEPITCADARRTKTHVGCDFWPTVTANQVAETFHFAVAVANGGTDPAVVRVTGPNGVNRTVTVAAGASGRIALPWVSALKGPTSPATLTASVFAPGGAYHLVSDRPVVVYQFNPLEFRSYSNDASLLLPSTAMTGNYRVMGSQGFSRHPGPSGQPDTAKPLEALGPASFVVTATADGTKVDVKLGPKGSVVGGGGVPPTEAGGTLTLTMNAGDVAEIVSELGRDFDFSGSMLVADKPVQLITSVACMDFPLDAQACDHVEETVFPVEALGAHYLVVRPTGPKGNAVGHVVRFFGTADRTTLTYGPAAPAGCPATLEAEQVVDCGEVGSDFEVSGSQAFGIGMFLLGGEKVDPDFMPGVVTQPQGDPSQTFAVAVERYQKRFVFFAPSDLVTSYVDVIAGAGTTLDLDGTDASSKLVAIPGTAYFSARLRLAPGGEGTHVLAGSHPIGIQVIGYGDNTSTMYPGGVRLDLKE